MMMNRHPVVSTFLFIGLFAVFSLVLIYILQDVEWGAGTSALSTSDKVAVLPIQGYITHAESYLEQLHTFSERSDIRAIVLRIDSPGGSVVPAQEIYEEVRKVSAGKVVVASMGNVAASGGYYIACAAEKIFSNPGTITGSIGVIFQTSHYGDLLEKIGLHSVTLKSGAYKDIGSPTREMTQDERNIIQGVIDRIHAQFVQAVVEGRRMEESKVLELADGRFFSGDQACSLGLVDALGNLDDAIDTAAEMAGIFGEPTVVHPKPERFRVWDLLAESVLTKVTNRLLHERFQVRF